MTVTRRGLLRVVAAGSAVGVAGCANRSDTGSTPTRTRSDTAGTTQTATRTVAPTPTNCPDEPRVPESDFEPERVEIPEVPEPPETLSTEQVTTYAKAYEFAYRFRDNLGGYSGPIVDVRLDAVAEVRSRGSNWVIVDVTGLLAGRWDPNPTEPGAPGSFDMGEYRASYLVTRDAVWRARTEFGGNNYEFEYPTPDPVTDGTLLECF